LLRSEREPDTKGEYFKKWVEDYMTADSKVAFTSEELWSARCGLLHTHTASSRLSRQGKARQLHYFRAHGAHPSPALQHAMKAAPPQTFSLRPNHTCKRAKCLRAITTSVFGFTL